MVDENIEETETLNETQELNEPSTPDILDMDDASFENYLETQETAVENTNDDTTNSSEDTNLEEEVDDKADTTTDNESNEETAIANTETPEKESQEGTDNLADDTKAGAAETSINFEAEYQKILAPFKANGKDVKVDSVEEALTLMQMGANYNKKMAGIKPNIKYLKTLEANGLLEDGKLDYLIDLSQKKPEAITKLIKEAGIDPLEIDTENSEEYTPTKHQVSDEEIELDNVFEEIRENESFNRTVKVVTEVMDDASQATLAQHPNVIKTIDTHIQTGIYDKVMGVVEKQRMLGNLKNVSDIAAYKMVGDKMHEQGLLKPEAAKPAKEVTPISKKPDPKLEAKRRAAGPVKSTTKTKVKPPYDPLSMSDEEFEKIAGNTYY